MGGWDTGTVNLNFAAANAPANNILKTNTGPGISLCIPRRHAGIVRRGRPEQQPGRCGGSGMQSTPGASQIVFNPGARRQRCFNCRRHRPPGWGVNSQGFQLNVVLSGASSSTNGFYLGTSTSRPERFVRLLNGLTINGNDWATRNAGNSVVAYTGYTDAAAVGTWSNYTTTPTTSNITNSTSGAFSGSLPGNLTIGSLRFDNNSGGTLNLGGNTLTVADGILVTSNVSGKSLTIGNSSSDVITGSNTTGSGNGFQLFVINNGSNGTTLNIAATINDSSTEGTLKTSFVKSGTGLVILSALNNYTGTTYVDQGVLEFNDLVPLGLISLQSGGVLGINANANVYGQGNVFAEPLTSSNSNTSANTIHLLGESGFAAYGGTVKVTLNSTALSWGTLGFLDGGSAG